MSIQHHTCFIPDSAPIAESGAMFIAAICFVVGAFFCSCTSQYTRCKNVPSASHLIRSESLLPNPNSGFGIIYQQFIGKSAFQQPVYGWLHAFRRETKSPRRFCLRGLVCRYMVWNQTFVTLAACLPLGPATTSNSTSSPSAMVLKPSP